MAQVMQCSLPSSQPGDHTRGTGGFKVGQSQEGQSGSCAGQDQSLKQGGRPTGSGREEAEHFPGEGLERMPLK